MTLPSGARLGPYEVLAPLGAGGMGEVYGARDSRIGRDVAIKVLLESFASDPERLRRFEQEVRAAGSLNHPNILAIFDVGSENASPYVVSELLEGETLRARLASGAMPVRKVIDYAVQFAHGLAAAHERGIVHRDLKPENLFVTRDGRLKILDFGLAKLTRLPSSGIGEPMREDHSSGTEPGMVMGTVGYMSPEQVRGETADHRSDIFSFGAVIYEMLSGRRAFKGPTAVEAMNAILKEDPPELATLSSVPPSLERVTRRCLEKNPAERFQSARDVAFALEAVSGSPLSGATAATRAAAFKPRPLAMLAAVLVALGVVVGVFYAGRKAGFTEGERAGRTPPRFQRLTFRRGSVTAARFAPDGQTVIYSAAWDGQPVRLFSTRLERPESQPAALPDAALLAISSAAEMAVALGKSSYVLGTLARVPLTGGAPRELARDTLFADWSPDGSSLAAVRFVDGQYQLEFPLGKVLRRTPDHLEWARVAPRGELVAFADFSVREPGAVVAVVDRAGARRVLSRTWRSVDGLAWSADGSEVWFTAGESASSRALRTVSLSGIERLIARTPVGITLHDVSRNGRVLLTHDDTRVGLMALAAGETVERDLSWFDSSQTGDISAGGERILFQEDGEGGGPSASTYIRKGDGSPAVRLSDGFAQALSPDGRWALVRKYSSTEEQQLLVPTGVGEPKLLPQGAVEAFEGLARWFPDGRRILFNGAERDKPVRCWVQDLEGGLPQPLTPESTYCIAMSPDGRSVAGLTLDTHGEGHWCLLSPRRGEPERIRGLDPAEIVNGFSADGHSLYVVRPQALSVKVFRFELKTGRRELWRELRLPDPAGVTLVYPPAITPDGRAYAYSYRRTLSELYVVEGLR